MEGWGGPLWTEGREAILQAVTSQAETAVVAFVLIVTRLTGLFLIGPVFGHPAAPIQIRVFLVLAVSLVLTPAILGMSTGKTLARYDVNADGVIDAAETPPGLAPEFARIRRESRLEGEAAVPVSSLPAGFPPPTSVIDLVRQMTGELLLGLGLGLGVLIWVSAMQFAGYLVDQQTGVSLGEVFNPELDVNSSVSGELLYWLGAAVFLLVGGLGLAIRTLIDSYSQLPLGYALVPEATYDVLIKLVGQSLVLVLQIAAPVLTTTAIVGLAMGLMSHTVPQLNVLIIGFPVRTLAGMMVLLVALARMTEAFAAALPGVLERIREGW